MTFCIYVIVGQASVYGTSKYIINPTLSSRHALLINTVTLNCQCHHCKWMRFLALFGLFVLVYIFWLPKPSQHSNPCCIISDQVYLQGWYNINVCVVIIVITKVCIPKNCLLFIYKKKQTIKLVFVYLFSFNKKSLPRFVRPWWLLKIIMDQNWFFCSYFL